METQTQQQEIKRDVLKTRLDAGYKKSVIVMVEDIVKEYAMRLDNGTREFKYIKSWPHKGSFMSPVYTQGDNMKCDGEIGYNTIIQPNEDVKGFADLVFKELEEKHGIVVRESIIEYRDNKSGWHHMRFVLTLSLADEYTE